MRRSRSDRLSASNERLEMHFPAESCRPLKVAIVSTSLSRAAGGILPIMQNHAIELRRRGLEVSVHGVADEFSRVDASGWGDVPLHLVRSRGPARLAYAPGLERSIGTANPDIVHQHGIWQYTSASVRRWRRRTGRPVVISVQGMLEPWAIDRGRTKKRIIGALFERDNLTRAAAVHSSRSEVAGVRAYVPDTPVAVLPNGARVPDGPEPQRPSFLPDDGRQTLLFLGRLHPKKGLAETLQAWDNLKRMAPAVAAAWRLVIAGWDEGGHAEALAGKAGALGLAGDVIFPGPLFGADKSGVLRHADAFILASYSEGFPMAIMEAFANGLPVFMTQECNIPEAFDAGAAIEITTDPKLLAEVLARELERPSQDLAGIGQLGIDLVAEHFSWETIAGDLDELYRFLLGWSRSRPKFLV